jgi:outer membrane protein TolC
MLNDINLHYLNEQLDGIEVLAQAVQYHQAGELVLLLSEILRRRRVQLENGYITRDDFDHIRLKYRQARLKKKLYDTDRKAALDASLHGLLNCIEFADLIALDKAQAAAVEQAYALKIQQNLIERSQYARSWVDDLTLNLYLEQRNDFNDSSRSNVGLEVKIPIHWDTKREPLMDQEKRLYEKQAAALTRRIMTNLEKLYDFFAFQQVRIRMLLLELEKSAQRKAYEQMRAERALEDLNHTPERSLDQIRMEEIDLRYEAIQARLKLYEILIKIAALTHADHPRDLTAGTQTHCLVR